MTQNQDFATGFLVTFFFFPINKTAVITSSVRDDIIIRSHFLLAHETSRDFKLPHVFFFLLFVLLEMFSLSFSSVLPCCIVGTVVTGFVQLVALLSVKSCRSPW